MSLDSKLTGLIGYWSLGDSSANRADLTGQAGSITVSGNIPLVSGLQNGVQAAYIENGSDSYLSLPAGICDIGTGAKSFSVWVNFNRQNVGYQWILCQGTGRDVTDHLIYLEGNSHLFIRFLVNGNWGYAIDSGISPTPNVWHHIVATYSGSVAQLFYDGNLVGSVNYPAAIQGSNSSFTLGRYNPYPNGVNGQPAIFSGSLQDLGIWNRALTLQEVKSIYNLGVGWLYPWRIMHFSGGSWNTAGNWYLDDTHTTLAGELPTVKDKVYVEGDISAIPGPTNYLEVLFNNSNLNAGLVLDGNISFNGTSSNYGIINSTETSIPPTLLIKMDGTDGSSSFIDSSPYNNQVNLIGNPGLTGDQFNLGSVSGEISDGNYLTVPKTRALIPVGNQPITVETWLYAATNQTGRGIICCQYNYGGGSTPIPYALTLYDFNGGMCPTFGSYNGNWTYAKSPEPLPLNQWVHLAGVYDGTSLNIYVNGVKKASAALSTMPNYYNVGNILIGNRWDEQAAFIGYMQEVRITNGVAVYTENFIPHTSPHSSTTAGQTSTGKVYFNNSSANYGTLNEPAIFNDLSVNYGLLNNTTIANYPVLIPLGGTLGNKGTLSYQNYPTKLYFYPAHSNDWYDILNWWTDYNHTKQCNFFPLPETTVYILGDLNSNSGPTINVNKIVVIDGTIAQGVSLGANNVELLGNAINNGTINNSSTTYSAQLVIDFEGTVGSSVFTDSSSMAHSITKQGSVVLSSAQAKVGTVSGYFDGGSYLSVQDPSGDLAPTSATQALTVEAWVYATTARPGSAVVSHVYNGGGGGTPIPFALCLNDGGGGCPGSSRPCFGSYNGGWTMAVADNNLPLNQWVHLAGVYDGTSLNIYVNGVLSGKTGLSQIPTYNPGVVYVGKRWDDSCGGNTYFNGYIESVRIVKGAALYTGSFTPSQSTITSSATVSGVTKLYDSAQNRGTINNYTYLYDHSFNTGVLNAGGEAFFPSVGNIRTSTVAGDFLYHTTPYDNLYFNGAVNNDWSTLGNWWKDIGCTVPATSLPTATTTAYINADINSITGGGAVCKKAVFTESNLSTGLTLSFPVEFRGSSSNHGTLNSQAITKTSVLLCNYNSSTAPTSSGAIDVNVSGNPQINNTTYKFNGGSCYFNGSSYIDYYPSAPAPEALFSFGTNDFTIEFWVYPTAAPGTSWTPFMSLGSQGNEIRISQNINNQGWGFVVNATGYSSNKTFPLNRWSHVALSKFGDVVTMYVDGIPGVSVSVGSNYNFIPTGPFRVGYGFYGGDGAYTGYIDDLRVISGLAVYTEQFTPPSSALANSVTGYTTISKLLDSSINYGTVNQNIQIFDSASNQGTINGNISTLTAGKRKLYFNNSTSNNWGHIGNWWLDENCTAPSNEFPDLSTRCVLLNNPNTSSLGISQCRTVKINNGITLTGFTLKVNDYLYALGNGYNTCTILGNSIFKDTAQNGGTLSGDNFFFDSSYNNNSGGAVLSGATYFSNNAYNQGTGASGKTITFDVGTHNSGTINGVAVFLQGVGGTYTVTGTDYWQGGSFNGGIKGRDGIAITNWVFRDYSTASYDANIPGNADFGDHSGTSPYYVEIYGNLILRGSAVVVYPRVRGTITAYDSSVAAGDGWGTGYCTGNAEFNDNSYNGGITVRGNAVFNNNSYNSGTINGNAIFNGSSYSAGGGGTGNRVLGNATFNTNYYSGTTVPTGGVLSISGDRTYDANIIGTMYDSTGAAINKFSFYGSSVLTRSVSLAQLEFNDSSYINWNVYTVGNIVFNDNAYAVGNNTIIGDVVFNDNSYGRYNVIVNGNVVCNNSTYLSGTVNSSTTWKDSISNAVGSLVNYNTLGIASPTYVAGSPAYLNFNGSGQCINFPRNSTNVDLVNNFSIEAWVNIKGNNEWGAICSYGDVANGEQWSLNTTGGGQFRFSSSPTYVNGPSYTQNTWTHVVVTFNNGVVKFYINGSLATSQTISATSLNHITGAYLSIGDNQYGGQEFVNGYIAGERIYNTALTTTQVIQNFSADYQRFSLSSSLYTSAVSNNGGVAPTSTGVITDNLVFRVDANNSTVTPNTAIFNDGAIGYADIYCPSTFNDQSWSNGGLYGGAVVTRATGGVLTLGSGQNWSGRFGTYSNFNSSTRYTLPFKGGDGQTITKLKYTGASNSGTGEYWSPTWYIDAEFHDTSSNNHYIVGTVDFYDYSTSAAPGGYGVVINGPTTFHDHSVNNVTIDNSTISNQYSTGVGNISFRDNSVNNGYIGDYWIGDVVNDAYFYNNAWNNGSVSGVSYYGSIVNGTWTLPPNKVWTAYPTSAGGTLGTDGSTASSFVFSGTGGNEVSIPGDAVFNGSSYNRGTVGGNATFNNNSYNGALGGPWWAQAYYGTVNGNATFNDNSYNRSNNNGILGNATFAGAGSYNTGTVQGDAIYASASGGVYNIPPGTQWGAGTINGRILDGNGDAILTWVFSGGSYNTVAIPGNAIFNDNGYNTGTINGNATFNSSSFNTNIGYNSGTITGDAVFNGNTYNGGTVNGDAVFNNNAYNGKQYGAWWWAYYAGTVGGNSIFNNNAYNVYTVSGNATFNDTAYNSGTVSGNVIFNTSTAYSTESSNIGGTATFNYASDSIVYWPINTNFVGTWGGALLDGNGDPITLVLSGTSQNQTSINSNAKFIDYSTNRGTVNGDAEFDDNTINQGTVTGNGTFRQNGYNDGNYWYNEITGQWVYTGRTGTVNGDAYVYVTIPNSSTTGWNVNFPLMGNVYGSIYYYNGPLYYNNASGDGDWNNLSNWWTTKNFQVNASALPDSGSIVFVYADILQNSGDPAEVYRFFASAQTPPSVDYNWDVWPPEVIVTRHGVNINIPITVGQKAILTGSQPSSYYDYGTGQEVNVYSRSTNNSTLTSPITVLDLNSDNQGTVIGNVDLKNNSINGGDIQGNANVYYPGIDPIGGTVTGTTTYYDFPAPYTLDISNINQEFIVPVAISPMVLSITGPNVQSVNFTLTDQYGWTGEITQWLNYNSATRTFTGTPQIQDSGKTELLTITVLADVPNYVNYSYTQQFYISPIFDLTVSPQSINVPISNPPTNISPKIISVTGRTPHNAVLLNSNSQSFSSNWNGYRGLPTGLSYDSTTRTISGQAQLDSNIQFAQPGTVNGSMDFDIYILGSPEEQDSQYVTRTINYTLVPDLVFETITNQQIGLTDKTSGLINIPVNFSGSGSLVSLTAEGLPDGLYLSEDLTAIVGTITLPEDSLPNNTFYVTLIASDGYYSNIRTSFTITTTELAIYPGQIISFFGRTAVSYNVTVTVPQLNNYTWNDPVGLPDGVTLDKSTGIISGSSTVEGTGVATLSITTTAGVVITGEIGWTVAFIPIVLSGDIISVDRYVPVNYSIPFTGDIPYTWSYTGNLPAGLTFNESTGKISGTTTVGAGSFPITVYASDPGGAYPTSGEYTVIVQPGTTYVSSTLTRTVYVGTALNYTIPYTGTPPDSWALVSGSTGQFSLNTQTGVISGTAPSTPVTLTFGVSAITDGTAFGPSNITLRVVYPPPVVTSGQTFNGTRNSPASFQLLATGGAVVNWTSSSLPRGLTLTSSTGVISGTPTQIGTFTITVIGTGLGGTSSASVSIVIAEILPVITPGQTLVLRAGLAIPSTAKVSTTGGVPTSWTLQPVSGDGNINIDNTGTFTGTAPTEIGSYNAYVTATNVAGTTAQVLVVLNVIIPPPILQGGQTLTVGANSSISFQVEYSGGTPTSWVIGNNPFGLTINSSGLITGIITSAGVFNYTVTANNLGGSSTTTVSFIVPGVSPVITPNQTLRLLVGNTTSLRIAYTGTATNWSLNQGSTLPEGITLNSGTGYISGVPVLPTGIFTPTVVVSNSFGFTKQVVNLNVYSIINQGQVFSGTKNASASFSIATSGGTIFNAGVISGSLPAGMTISSSGIISGKPSEAGSFVFTVGAQTSYGFNTAQVTINIADIAPVIPTGQVIRIQQGLNIPPGTKPSYTGGTPSSWTMLPIVEASGLTINSITGEYLGAAPTTLGNYSSFVTASNAVGSSGSVLVTLTVTEQAPVLLPIQTITVGAYSTFSVQIDYTGGTPSNWSITNNNYGIAISNSGLLTGTIPVTGNFSYTVTATNSGGSSSIPISISVPGVSPVITPNQVVTGNIGRTLSYSLNYTGVATSWELANQSVLPSGLYFNSSTGEIFGTPEGPVASYTIAFKAINNYGSTTQNVTIRIRETPPVTTAGQTFSGITYSQLSFNVATTGGTASSWSATNLPSGLAIDSTTGVITGTVATAGVFVAVITATNSGGSSSQAITITITSNAPSLTQNQVFIVPTGKSVSLTPSYTGSTPSVWSASGLPSGLTIDSVSGRISGTTTVVGNYTVNMSLQAPVYGTTTGQIVINVVSVSSTLLIQAGQELTVPAGSAISFVPSVLGTPTVWALSGAPSWLTINENTGRITGTPTSTGATNVCVYIKDVDNLTAAAFVTINVI